MNTNTVLRALRQLRDEGLLEFRRGRGVTVLGRPEQSALIAQARELVQLARHHGYRLDELLDLIQTVCVIRRRTTAAALVAEARPHYADARGSSRRNRRCAPGGRAS